MKGIFFLRGMILSIFLVGCGEKESYFKGEIVTVADIPITDTLRGEKLVFDSINSGMLSLCDTVLFFMSHRTPDYHYICFNSQGQYIAKYFSKGRGNGEFLNITPIIQKYEENGECKALFTAVNEEKAGIFNVTKSIEHKKTVCDSIFDFKWSDKSDRPFISVFLYDKDYILAYKQPGKPNSRTNKSSLPQWLLINRHSGEIDKTYDLFAKEFYNPVAEELNAAFYSSFNILSNDRKKMLMSMVLVPQINILDLETGKLKGFRLADQPGFDDLLKKKDGFKQYYGFSEIDDRYIYALYVDDDYRKPQENQDCTIHVFDWNGQLVHKLYLTEGIDQIQVDAKNRILYGVNMQMEEVYRYHLPF